MITCCIFDLDGVLVDTARFHYLAWSALARELGFEFSESQGEATKGVSRMASLEIVLRAGGLESRFSQAEKEELASRKNMLYLSYVSKMRPSDVFPGCRAFLEDVGRSGVNRVLGSASKNAGLILDRCALRPFFEAVVDGTTVTRAKPDPEVFVQGAHRVGASPSACVVFEDAAAGIEAATRAGMRSVGMGGSPALSGATFQLRSFEDFTYEMLCRQID